MLERVRNDVDFQSLLRLKGEFIVADWSAATVRYFQCSPLGNDNNPGYADGAPVSGAGVATIAVRTLAKLLSLIPKNGAGRKAVGIIEAGDYSAEDLSVIGFVGYRGGLLFTGTCTDSTAGVTAFANDTADKRMAGGVRATGTETLGYRVSANPTTTSFDVVRAVDGGAANLLADPGLRGMRVRFSATTPTVALRNANSTIRKNATGNIELMGPIPATPAAGGAGVGDEFFIEQPGVVVRSIEVTGCYGGERVFDPVSTFPISTGSVNLIGFRTTRTGGTAIWGGGNQGVGFAFCHADPGGATGSRSNVAFTSNEFVGFFNSYSRPEDGAGIVTGGCRIAMADTGTNTAVAISNTQRISWGHSAAVHGSTVLSADAHLQYLGGTVYRGIVSVSVAASFAISAVGNQGFSSVRPLLISSPTSAPLAGRGTVNFDGIDVEGIPDNTNLVNFPTGFHHVNLQLNAVTATVTGTGKAIDVSGVRCVRVAIGPRAANTITAPANQEVVLSGVTATFADFQTSGRRIEDARGNVVVGGGTGLAPIVAGAPVIAGPTGLQAYEFLAADPRVAGLDRPVGSRAFTATTAYDKIGTGTRDWAPIGASRFLEVTGSPVSQVDLTGLDGDTDKTIRFGGFVINAIGGDIDVRLRPDGQTTNLSGSYGGVVEATSWRIASGRGGERCYFEGWLRADASGTWHGMFWTAGYSTSAPLWGVGTMLKTSASGGITFLRFIPDQASAVGVGSQFWAHVEPRKVRA